MLLSSVNPSIIFITTVIRGDDKVMPGQVSAAQRSGGLPLRLEKASASGGTIAKNYHMNMTTAPRPVKTINLLTPSAAKPDNPLDIPS